MEFQTHQDRDAAIEAACKQLGEAYGELKLREHLLRETQQSFVAGNVKKTGPVSESVNNTTVVEAVVEAPAPKAKAKAKPAPKPKKADVQTELPVIEDDDEDAMTVNTGKAKVEAEDILETEVSEPSPVVEDGDDFADDGDCPIKSVADLRGLMLKRYNELGKTPEVQAALKAAIKESTGVDQAAQVPEDKFADAYAAIMAVEV